MSDFELRQLKSSDMFVMFGILNKIGFKDIKAKLTPERVKELSATFKKGASEAEQNEQMTFIGFSIIMDIVEIIMNNLPSCEKDIYTFLANLSGKTQKEIADLDMVTFTKMIVAVLQKEEFKDFIKVVSELFNQGN